MIGVPVASALRSARRGGYSGTHLRADLMAGAVVGVVALPLSMALAVASGVAPQHGLYTAIVGFRRRVARRLALSGLWTDGRFRLRARTYQCEQRALRSRCRARHY